LTATAKTGGCAAKLGPGELSALLGPALAGATAGGPAREAVLVGPETGDDAGVYLFEGRALVATADFIPPVCDDPRRYGRVAAANALSDVWAMGGEPLFVLNLCAFPTDLPPGVTAAILEGAASAVAEADAVVLGGHTVRDPETKFGLAVVGVAAPDRILALGGALPGQRVVLTKPLGTGVLVNAFKHGKLDAAGLEPALVEMERLNRDAARAALAHGATAATDVTGFSLAGHAWHVARESRATLALCFDALPVHPGFFDLVRAGVTTGCTPKNRDYASPRLGIGRSLAPEELELLFDPQTSGGLLVTLPRAEVAGLLADLAATGHRAAEIGEVVRGPARLELR
jgi:selenide,water dikinase